MYSFVNDMMAHQELGGLFSQDQVTAANKK
jgi:hypothetical protein